MHSVERKEYVGWAEPSFKPSMLGFALLYPAYANAAVVPTLLSTKPLNTSQNPLSIQAAQT